MVPTSEERARATYQRSRPAPIYRAWRGCLTATAQDRLRVGDLDLLAVAAVVDLHQRVVALVGRAAHRVRHQHHAIAEIDRAEHGGEHAHVGLRVARHPAPR